MKYALYLIPLITGVVSSLETGSLVFKEAFKFLTLLFAFVLILHLLYRLILFLSSFEILTATYAPHDETLDETLEDSKKMKKDTSKEVHDYVTSIKPRLYVSNRILGDPAIGLPKKLQVDYVVYGKKTICQCSKEGEIFDLTFSIFGVNRYVFNAIVFLLIIGFITYYLRFKQILMFNF